jgi:hypothetical protein
LDASNGTSAGGGGCHRSGWPLERLDIALK